MRSQGLLLLKTREEYIAKNGKEPGLSVLCELLGMESEEAAAALCATSALRSLDERIGSEQDGMCLSQIIPDPDNCLDKITDRLALSQAMASLSPMQRKIIYLRYVKDLSQQATGKLLGLSQVKISREEKKILQQLSRAL